MNKNVYFQVSVLNQFHPPKPSHQTSSPLPHKALRAAKVPQQLHVKTMDLRGKGSANSSIVDENNAFNANNQQQFSLKQRPLIMPMHSRQQPILRFPSVGS